MKSMVFFVFLGFFNVFALVVSEIHGFSWFFLGFFNVFAYFFLKSEALPEEFGTVQRFSMFLLW